MINYEYLCSKIAVELAKWAFYLKYTYSNNKERVKAIKLFRLANKYEKRYRENNKYVLYYEEAGRNLSSIKYYAKIEKRRM